MKYYFLNQLYTVFPNTLYFERTSFSVILCPCGRFGCFIFVSRVITIAYLISHLFAFFPRKIRSSFEHRCLYNGCLGFLWLLVFRHMSNSSFCHGWYDRVLSLNVAATTWKLWLLAHFSSDVSVTWVLVR